MFVMNVSGGFANQLFRFACGYQISKKYDQEMVLHIYDKRCYVDAFLLDELKICNYKKIYMRVERDVEKVAKLLGLKKIIVINEENYDCLNENIFAEDTLIYVDAPFQRLKYFDIFLDEIRDMFQLKNVSEEMRFFKQKILNQNSVAIHVRRRDFVDIRNAMESQHIDSFYKAAIVYFRKILESPIFYIFSDDISFCIDFFGEKEDIRFVKIPGGKDADIEEFFCISWCTHRILTKGSSFGRMADLLNDGKGKVTVYQGNEEDKEHIVYLGDQKISELCKEYEDSKIRTTNASKKMDFKAPDIYFDYNKEFEKNILSVYLEKVKRQYKANQLVYAEQTLIKAWQYGYNDSLFHKYYFDVLYDLGKREESIIEAVAYLKYGGKKEEIENKLTKDNICKIEAFIKKEMLRFIIVPQEPFRNTELNQLCNLGILLQRMGYEVYYFFCEAQEGDGGNIAANNQILVSNYMFTNCEGYMYQSRMYDMDIIKKQYKIEEFIDKSVGDKLFYIVSDIPGLLAKCKNEKMIKVYWKAINTYRYYHDFIQHPAINHLKFDWIVSDSESERHSDKCIVINKIPLWFETDKELSLSSQYMYDKDLFYVIEKIILWRDK